MIWEILDRQTDIAALCEDLAVRRLYVFGARREGASLARIEDLDFLVEFWPMDPESTTIFAASGSHQMLCSAAGVTFPTAQQAPPMT